MERKIDTRESVRVVTSNNFIKAAGLQKISLKARKLLYLTIAQCKKDDKGMYEYKLSATEFASLMDISVDKVYQESDSITDELMNGFLKCYPAGAKKYKKYQLFITCEYGDGILKLELSKQMSPFVLDLKKDFTQPLLRDFVKMRSNYSIEVWHLMQMKMKSKKPLMVDICTFDITLNELREVTGTQEKFKQICQFKEKVLDKAIREIKDNCGVVVSYDHIKKGRTIVGFHFTAKAWNHVEPDDIPQSLLDRVEEGKKRIAAAQVARA